MNQGGRGRGSGGGELVRLPVRWVVLFTGYKATEDYVPAASEGENAALVKEATDICVAFHPHSEIRLFPKEAMLFWRATSTRDWVITRVSIAPNPDGIRTALEYSSVVLDEEAFRELGYNPFRSRDLELHEKVRAQYFERTGKPLWVDVPDDKFVATHASETNGARPSAAFGAAADEIIPGLGSDRVSSVDNVEKIEKYCAYCANVQKVPPTFATWWPSGDPPADYFEVVLRSAQARTMTLRDATDSVAALSAEITAALPRTTGDDTIVSELARTVLSNLDMAQRALSDAGTRLNSETVDQFREHLTVASNSVSQVAATLNSIVKRMDDRISSTDASRLTRLAQQSESLGPEFLGIRHPNPFAARTPSMIRTASTRVTKDTVKALGTSKPSYGPIAAIVVAIAVIVGVIALMAHRPAPGDNGALPHTTKIKPAGKPAAVASARSNPAQDPAFAKVVGDQDAVAETAKSNAQDLAKTAAAADVNTALSDSALDAITVSAVKSAYRKDLDDADYKTVFGSGKHAVTTYDDQKTLLPLLVSSVHDAAALAATQVQSTAKIKSAASAVQSEKDKALEVQRKTDAADHNSTAATPRHDGGDVTNSTHSHDEARHGSTRASEATPAPHRPAKSDASNNASSVKKPASSGTPASKSGSADQNGL